MDDFPILSLARMVRESARGIALRDDGRAVGVAFKSDGSIFALDCIVRFDIADSEDPARRLADAFADRLAYPVHANEVFARLNPGEADGLRSAGFNFYDWGAPADRIARFVVAWDTPATAIDALLTAIARA